MSEIGQIFENVSNNSKEIINEEANYLLEELASHKFAEYIILPGSEESIVYYVAGYTGRSLIKSMKCISCDELVSTGKCNLVVNFEVDGNTNDLEKGAKDEILSLVNRGGLIKPSDLLFVTCVHAAAFFKYIKSKEYIFNILINASNPRSVFSSLFMKKIEDNDETAALLNNECPQIAMKIFNIVAKNFINERNDNIHKERKRKVNSKLNKRDKYTMKQQKLSSKN